MVHFVDQPADADSESVLISLLSCTHTRSSAGLSTSNETLTGLLTRACAADADSEFALAPSPLYEAEALKQYLSRCETDYVKASHPRRFLLQVSVVIQESYGAIPVFAVSVPRVSAC